MKSVWKWTDAVVRLTDSRLQICCLLLRCCQRQERRMTSDNMLMVLQTSSTWDNTNMSAVLILPSLFLSHFRWSTPLLEARLKGYTSTTSSWVWYYWPEDVMKRRPSVSSSLMGYEKLYWCQKKLHLKAHLCPTQSTLKTQKEPCAHTLCSLHAHFCRYPWSSQI